MKVASIVGARPQFVKAAPVSRALERYNRAHPDRPLQEILVHTGQHYDYEMSEIFFKDLELKEPDFHLDVGSGTHAYQIGEMLKRVETVLLGERPDWVLVYGDTNSTLAGALAAAKVPVPVAHVEAGLRSFNRRMPEESNRVLTDHVSSLLLCPTETAVKNLAQESITRGVHLVGDVMYDTLVDHGAKAEKHSTILTRLQLRSKEYILVTVHRAENTDDPARLDEIVGALEDISTASPVVWPVHPRTRQALERYRPSPLMAHRLGVFDHPLRMIDPVSYLDMLVLEKEAKVVLTDSGGVQKEAYLLGVPCVTLREETEWVETVEAGRNVLVGADRRHIVEAATNRVWSQTRPLLFGDGHASDAIVHLLAAYDDTRRNQRVPHPGDQLVFGI